MTQQRFIDGIFNYCDRWCERCSHTAVCRVYRDEHRADKRHERRGEDPRDWEIVAKDMARSFEKTRRLLKLWSKEQGIDFDELREEALAAPPPPDYKAEEHPLCVEGMRYMKQCGELLEALHNVFNEAREDTAQRAAIMDVQREADMLAKVRDAAVVLGWDHTMVAVKTQRAMEGCLEKQADPDSEVVGDAEGTATVVLRCLDRDKLALLAVYEWDEQFQNAAIDLLACAERISRGLKQLIPGSTTFVWPPT
jgi:chorismate mutase